MNLKRCQNLMERSKWFMPWLAKRYKKYNSLGSLVERLKNEDKVMLKSGIIFWPFSFLTWVLFIVCAVAIPYLLHNYDLARFGSQLSLWTTLSILLIIFAIHTFRHKRKGLVTEVSKEAIFFPQPYVDSRASSYVAIERITAIHIQRFFYHYNYTKPDEIFKRVAKVEVHTHVRFDLNNGGRVSISRGNMPAVVDLVEYVLNHHSPKVTYGYPTPFKVLGLGIICFFSVLFFRGIYLI